MPFGESTPFILIARCHVKQDCLAAYLEAAEVADKAVKESEPGMLHHTFDQDPTDPLAFTWSEVYKDDASLLFHLTNPPLVKFVEQHGEMGDDFSVEIYGTIAPATKEACNALPFPVKYFDTKFGYSRVA
uniref:ABM domain-containing protein n=1 Tax=Emiliania huxleyi TaxID=2903 RepID=A0A7S3SUP7_EMIHU|mmetsp:Transcript_6900/g.19922  ORF Transcript_6900/g.19922 Transcript_6900/m.19922 type:complete len:130 (+) Transcript_6900:43-432(+)